MDSNIDYWRTACFRKNVIQKIEDEIIKLNLITAKSSQELENEEFQKSHSKEEYMKLIAKLIYFMRLKKKKENDSTPEPTFNSIQNIRENSNVGKKLMKLNPFKRNKTCRISRKNKKNYYCAICYTNFSSKNHVKNHIIQNQHFLTNTLPSSFKSMLPSQWLYTVCDYSKIDNNYVLKICLPNISSIKGSQDWMSEFMKINHCAYVWERSVVKDDSVQEVIYSCQHVEKRSKNMCKSKISFLIRKDEMSFAITSIDFDHNHSLIRGEESRQCHPSAEVKEILFKYFEHAANPVDAFRSLQIHIEMQFETEEEYLDYITDRRKMPVLNWARQLYNTEYSGKYQMTITAEDIDLLKKFIGDKNDEYGECVCQFQELPNNHFVIFITTPLMKRALKSQAANELIYTDNIGLTAQYGVRVYLLFTNIKDEAVPLAVMITTSETNKAIKTGFSLLSNIIDDQTERMRPAIIMTDDSIAEMTSMKALFPYSKIVLSVFHFLKACYKWLSKIEHKISKRNRQTIYSFIRQMVYARDELELKSLFDNLIKLYLSQEVVNNYIYKLYEKRQTWALCHRKNFLSIESRRDIWKRTICTVKEQILSKIKTQEPKRLISYFLNEFSDFYRRRLIDCALNRYELFNELKLIESQCQDYSFMKSDFCESLFICQNKSTNVKYLINNDINLCTCYFGFTGAICEHQKFLYCLTDELLIDEENDAKTKLELYYIVSGCRDVPEEFFGLSINQDLCIDKPLYIEDFKTEECFVNAVEAITIESTSNMEFVQPLPDKFLHEVEIDQLKEGVDVPKQVYPIIIKNDLEDDSIVKIDETQTNKSVESIHTILYSYIIKDERSQGMEVVNESDNVNHSILSENLCLYNDNNEMNENCDMSRELVKFNQNLSRIYEMINKNPSYYKDGLAYLNNELEKVKQDPQALLNALNYFKIKK